MARKRVAFVTGSNGPAWETQLHFAKKDAKRIGECLKRHCGFAVSYSPDTGDSHDIARAVMKVMAECRAGDDLIVYLSGHGHLYGGRLFFLCDDTTTSIFDSAINVRTIVEAMEMCAATHKLIILDCCHAGAVAGFKGAQNLEPVLKDTGSQLVLCASSRLERAREFHDLEGSFLAHSACLTLESTRNPSVSLTQLVEELRAAAMHRAGDLHTAVPQPFLFGEQRSSFIIKAPKGISPVQLKIIDLFSVDTELLAETLSQYAKWSIQRLNSMPVEVILPHEIGERIDVLRGYLESDDWPTIVNDGTRKQVATLSNNLIPDLVKDLVQAVRTMTAAAVASDGTRLVRERDLVLKAYLSARVFATFRLLRAMWFHNEAEPSWGNHFVELDTIWNNRLISGLTWIVQREAQWSFWTDADWFLQTDRVRVFVPQLTGNGERDLADFTKQQFLQIFLPQLLEGNNYQTSGFLLRTLLTQEPKDALKTLVYRTEAFIETESHNSPARTDETLARTARITSAYIASRLLELRAEDRRRALIRLVPVGSPLDVISRVRRLVPGI